MCIIHIYSDYLISKILLMTSIQACFLPAEFDSVGNRYTLWGLAGSFLLSNIIVKPLARRALRKFLFQTEGSSFILPSLAVLLCAHAWWGVRRENKYCCQNVTWLFYNMVCITTHNVIHAHNIKNNFHKI